MTAHPIDVVGACDPNGRPLTLHISDGRFTRLAGPHATLIDATGLVAVPGFLDLQVNGAAGIDVNTEPERLWEVAAALPAFGVTRFLPTIVTGPAAIRERALSALRAGPPAGWAGAVPLGVHFEGPMISRDFAGAHDADFVVEPCSALVEGWSAAAGVAMVTLAPELPGATGVTRALASRGVVVSAGHTGADDTTARRAVAAGVSAITHLFNAMRPTHHRDPGIVGAMLLDLPIVASLIADGHHLDPDVLALAWRALGPERRFLVSDATAALGASRGEWTLGTRAITWDGTRVSDGQGGLAGAGAGLDDCVRHVIAAARTTLADVVPAVTAIPARLLGRMDLGSLQPGAEGDLVLLDGDARVVCVVVAGVVVFDRTGG